MKNLAAIIFVLIFCSCQKEEIVDYTSLQLVGSTYMTFHGKVDYSMLPDIVHDYRDVYNVLYFKKDSVEEYLWEKIGINGKSPYISMTYKYSFNNNKLIIEKFGNEISGIKSGDTLKIFDSVYVRKN